MIVALDALIRLLRALSRVTIILSGIALIGLCAAIGAEVLMRKLFNLSFQGVDEIAGYTLAVTATLAFTYTLLERAHIRIDVLYRLVPERLQRFMDLLALAGLIVFFGMVLDHGAQLFFRSFEMSTRSMTPLQIPLSIPQGLWALSLALFVATSAVLLVRATLAVFTGDVAAARRLAAPRSVGEEVDEEVTLARRLGGGTDR